MSSCLFIFSRPPYIDVSGFPRNKETGDLPLAYPIGISRAAFIS